MRRLSLVFCAAALLALGCGSSEDAGREEVTDLKPLATKPPATTKLVAVGDIGDESPLPNCQDETAALVARIDPDFVLALGDIAYPNGTLADFKSHYDPWWGRFKRRTQPVPGNHEQLDADRGYDAYFGSRRRNYSYDVGSSWHLVALDTSLGDSAALRFLRRNLRRPTAPCLLMYLHHPLHSSGALYAGGIEAVKPLYRAFYARAAT